MAKAIACSKTVIKTDYRGNGPCFKLWIWKPPFKERNGWLLGFIRICLCSLEEQVFSYVKVWKLASVFLNKIQSFQMLLLHIFCKAITSIFCPLSFLWANSDGSWKMPSEDCEDHRSQTAVGHVGSPLSRISSAWNGRQFSTHTPKSVLQIIYQKESRQNFSLPDCCNEHRLCYKGNFGFNFENVTYMYSTRCTFIVKYSCFSCAYRLMLHLRQSMAFQLLWLYRLLTVSWVCSSRF